MTGLVQSQRVGYLDGLRGVAIVLVLVHHFIVPLLDRRPASVGAYIAASLSLSYTGVDLFFVLSGFLIGGILMDHRDSPKLFQVFYLRRALRILPIAFLCIALILLAQGNGLLDRPEGGQPWSPVAYFLLAINLLMAATGDWGYRPLSHLWSLGIEEQFYLVAPFLLFWVKAERWLLLILGFVLVAPLTRWLVLCLGANSLTASLYPFCRTDCLGLGMLVAWIVRSPAGRLWCGRHHRWLVGLFVAVVVPCAMLTTNQTANGSRWLALGGYSCIALLYALVLLYLELNPGTVLRRAFDLFPLRLLGRYSYFLYLFQGLIVGLVVGAIFHHSFLVIAPESLWQCAVALLGLFALAALSWKYFEAPLINLGRRWCY